MGASLNASPPTTPRLRASPTAPSDLAADRSSMSAHALPLPAPPSPEAAALLLLARVHPDAGAAAQARALTAGSFDWEALLGLTRRHQVTSLVDHALETTGPH